MIFSLVKVQLKMLNSGQPINKQLDRLEKISERISDLIGRNDFEKINHLDKIRKKIINDIQEKNYVFNNDSKQTVLKLISKNQKIISKCRLKNTENLKKIQDAKKCSEAYIATL